MGGKHTDVAAQTIQKWIQYFEQTVFGGDNYYRLSRRNRVETNVKLFFQGQKGKHLSGGNLKDHDIFGVIWVK